MFAVALMVALSLAAPSQQVLAKGAVRSGQGSDQRSENRSNDKRTGDDRRSSDSVIVTGGSSRSETRDSRSSRDFDSRIRTTTRHEGTSTYDGREYRPNDGWKKPTGPVVSSSTERKEFAEIGRIWKERQERRNESDDTRYPRIGCEDRDDQYRYWHRDGDCDRDRVHYRSRVVYRHYGYDYDDYRYYPSPYCYYTGLFPPYVSISRLVYHSRPSRTWVYIDLPIYCDDDAHRRYGYYYYTSDSRYGSLTSALRDVQRAWEREDEDYLMRHLSRREEVDIYLNGSYRYSVDRGDFVDMTRDAMNGIRTVSFRFDKVRRRGNNEAVAHAKHVYYDSGYWWYDRGDRNTVYVSYTFERYGDTWYITEVGTSRGRLY